MQFLFGRSLAALPLALALITTPAFAQQGPAVDPPAWAPPEIGSSKMDRITLKTGETLYGEFEILRDREVHFDSDEFDDLDVKWNKIVSIQLVSPHLFRLERRNVTGTAEMREGVVRVLTSRGEVIEFARDEIISIVPGGETETSYWSGSLGLDISVRDGNTDQRELSGDIRIKRETGRTRWISDYRGVYSELDGEKNTENHRANSNFDIFITRRFFVTTPSVEYYRDEFQNIKVRLTPGVALGYEFFRNAVTDWDATLGGSYQYTDFFEGSTADHDFVVTASTRLDIDITSDIDLDTVYQLQLSTTDLDKTNHHFETELSNDIWGPVELDITFIFDRIEKPVADNVGIRPKSNDLRLMLGLSADF